MDIVRVESALVSPSVLLTWCDVFRNISLKCTFLFLRMEPYCTDSLAATCSGNGYLWYDESKTHFTAWALMKSPLLIVSGSLPFCPISLTTCCVIYRALMCVLPTKVYSLFDFLIPISFFYVQLSKASEETLSIFKNEEIIAINQDNVIGTAVTPFRWGINVRIL